VSHIKAYENGEATMETQQQPQSQYSQQYEQPNQKQQAPTVPHAVEPSQKPPVMMKILTRLCAILSVVLSVFGLISLFTIQASLFGGVVSVWGLTGATGSAVLKLAVVADILGSVLGVLAIALNIVSRIKKVRGNLLIVLAVLGLLVGIGSTMLCFRVIDVAMLFS
jgi:hypothetical protein